jgi:RNA-binding protein YlmH
MGKIKIAEKSERIKFHTNRLLEFSFRLEKIISDIGEMVRLKKKRNISLRKIKNSLKEATKENEILGKLLNDLLEEI